MCSPVREAAASFSWFGPESSIQFWFLTNDEEGNSHIKVSSPGCTQSDTVQVKLRGPVAIQDKNSEK